VGQSVAAGQPIATMFSRVRAAHEAAGRADGPARRPEPILQYLSGIALPPTLHGWHSANDSQAIRRRELGAVPEQLLGNVLLPIV
jgi:hypothetical protein